MSGMSLLPTKKENPLSNPHKTQLTCPHCGLTQAVPSRAFSTVCKQCGTYLRVEELLKPERKVSEVPIGRKQIACFDCGTALEVSAGAQSTMCKRCSSYIDLLDYNIAHAVSKNFKTKGAFVIQPKGYVFNSEAMVADAVIKGRFLGKLFAVHSLTIHSTAEIKGTFTTGLLIIPAGNHFRWQGQITVTSAEIAGELVADVRAITILVKPGGRLFGNIEGNCLTVEGGGVMVGDARIRSKKTEEAMHLK